MTLTNLMFELKSDFNKRYWTQLIDDYGDEHLYDGIWSWIEQAISQSINEDRKHFRNRLELVQARPYEKYGKDGAVNFKSDLLNLIDRLINQ